MSCELLYLPNYHVHFFVISVNQRLGLTFKTIPFLVSASRVGVLFILQDWHLQATVLNLHPFPLGQLYFCTEVANECNKVNTF